MPTQPQKWNPNKAKQPPSLWSLNQRIQIMELTIKQMQLTIETLKSQHQPLKPTHELI